MAKRAAFYSQGCICLRYGERAAPPFSQLCLFLNSCGGRSVAFFQRSGRQGQPRPWRRRAGLCPGASGSLFYLPEAGAQHPQELGSGKVQGVGRVAELLGPTLSSREKHEKPLWPSRLPPSSRAGRASVWVRGAWRQHKESPAAWGAEARLCLPGTYCLGSYGLKNP